MSFKLTNENGINTIRGENYYFFAYDNNTTQIRISPLITSGITQSRKNLFAANTESECQLEATNLGFTIIQDEDLLVE